MAVEDAGGAFQYMITKVDTVVIRKKADAVLIAPGQFINEPQAYSDLAGVKALCSGSSGFAVDGETGAVEPNGQSATIVRNFSSNQI